ncbi:MAG TPA: Do family serine endopeptidase [Beijerinckiaceae bacterium]|nr:Do family serine endopeptidase [Beijerinckiaceae bacterium]
MPTTLLQSVKNGLSASLRRTGRAIALAALGTSLIVTQPLPAFAKGPDSLADLAQSVMDSVVNIKASQKVDQRAVPLPQLPPGSPFEDLFNEFFNRRGGPGGPEGPGGPGRPPQRGSSLGSGFVIDAAGVVVTNNHVIADANEITVVFNDGKELKAELVGKDPKIDIAVLRVKPASPLKAVKFGDSSAMRVGDWVMAIGNPFGFGGSVSAGIVSAKDRNIRSGPYDNFIQTDAAINKGNSGGPLFNMSGDVIGVNTAIVSPTGGSIGIGFAVPSAMVSGVVDQLLKFGETRRGWLGVAIQDVDDAMAESLNIGKARGAFVSNVDPKGPSKTGGIEREDVIIKFDGKEIKSSRDLPRIVADTPVGKEVEVLLLRGGKEVTKTIALGRLEDGEKQASAASKPSDSKDGDAGGTKAAGLELGALTPDLRRRFQIKDGVEGVVILRVTQGSKAAERFVQAGDVIVEVQRTPVKTVADVTKRLQELKKDGRANALFYIANAQGDLRYVTLPVE